MFDENSTNSPLISVIICSLNRAHIIDRAVRSLLAQSYANWEAIIADDASDDDTFQYAKRLCDDDDRFKYLYFSRRSLGPTRNAGINACSGDYITFLDTDDEYAPNHLATRTEIIAEMRPDLLYGGLKIIGDPFVPDAENPGAKIHLDECSPAGTFFLKRDIFAKIGYFEDISFADDYRFFQKAKAANLKIIKTSEPSYIYYRDAPDSICNTI
jgi:glycosyltransferase involved in cell wall biosynthesis